MEQSEIIEGNRLIADFMGVKIGEAKYSWRPGCTDPLQEHHLNYHASWGWIMPVVEKIENLGFDSRIMGNNSDGGYVCDFVDINNNEATCQISYESKIEAVWLAVLDFIKLHNTQSLTPNT